MKDEEIQQVAAEKREQVRGLEKLTILQQEQLEVQRGEIADLSRSLQIQLRGDTPQGSGQREMTRKNVRDYRFVIIILRS